MYLAAGEVLDDVALHLLFFHRVWIQAGNVHCSVPISHFEHRLSFFVICEPFLVFLVCCSFGVGSFVFAVLFFWFGVDAALLMGRHFLVFAPSLLWVC